MKEHSLRRRGRTFTLEAGDFGTLALFEFSQETFVEVTKNCWQEWQTEVERARVGRWHYLGCTWDPVPLADLWHFDPVSGEYWEREKYCFDVAYRHRPDRGDIKYTWEMNRLQILPVAAALFRAKGQKEDLRFCLEVMESWIDSNPPFLGVNWNSGIELALRIMSFTTAVSLLGQENIPENLKLKLVKTLNAHLVWLNRYPSKYSSANNHLIAELSATYILGRLMPRLNKAKLLADRAFVELGEQILCQIHEDGVGAEQSPTYSCFALEWVLLALNMARHQGEKFEPQVMNRLKSSAKHLRWMMDEGGNVPRIGDDDEGRVILSGGAREEDYVRNILSSLAEIADCPEYAPLKDRAHLRQIWTGRAASAGPSPEGAGFFDEGGYSVFRHSGKGLRSLIALDHGPLGHLSIAAHGHADALSVWWHLNDQPVFVDAGTYLYHSGGEARDMFRGTMQHNTLCLSSKDQSKISGAFNWSNPARAKRVPMSQTAGGLCAVGRHDGYKKPFGVIHERKLALDAPYGYSIRDQLLGTPKKGLKEVCLTYVLHPSIAVNLRENGSVDLLRDGKKIAGVELWLRPDDTLRRSGSRVHFLIEEVAYSGSFGTRETTCSLRARFAPNDLKSGWLETKVSIDAA
ncbi:alginate lyase family protein [Falsihalocynthiibacter arcticus]|uniref:heparinase II/III family protein n=2 Tax=Falsihalocynthiibacter TaxID=2854182 RepID=UPI0030026926